jgi:hypothetical protein
MNPESNERLAIAARAALKQMCRATAPDNSYTDAVDALDAALTEWDKQRHLLKAAVARINEMHDEGMRALQSSQFAEEE